MPGTFAKWKSRSFGISFYRISIVSMKVMLNGEGFSKPGKLKAAIKFELKIASNEG